METFVIREIVNDVLISLGDVLARVPRIDASFWSFKYVRLQFGKPFGIVLPEFERLSRELKGGLVVSNADFEAFLQTEFQFIDGTIEAYIPSGFCVHIECEDASQWEIATDQPEFIKYFEEGGFTRTTSD